jgi:hypothetical protein
MGRRRLVGAKLAAMLLIGAGAPGCNLSSEPVGRLDLSLSLSTTAVNADSGAVIRVIAVNRGSLPVDLETTGGCVVAFRLVGPDGAPFRPWPEYGCASILRIVSVAPGDSVVGTFNIIAQPHWDGNGVSRWPSGTYQVVGQLLSQRLEVVEETPPTEFRLTCHDPAWPEC